MPLFCHGEVVNIQDRKSSVVFIFHRPLFRLFLLKVQAIPAGVTHKSIQHGQDTLLSEKEIAVESDRHELDSRLHHSPARPYYTNSHSLGVSIDSFVKWVLVATLEF